jgi:predicted metal-dependent phosphoesterase TrpH
MIDLHIHTTASSDGQHGPEEIFEISRGFKLEAIAFADHNSMASVGEGLRISREFGIEFLPCIEINTHYKGYDFHLLGYFIDHRDERFLRWLEGLGADKKRQIRRRVRRLRELGFTLSVGDVERLSIGREPTGVSYLNALLERKENRADPRLKAYIDGERSDSPYLNFYLDYLAGGRPASVPIRFISTPEAIQVVRSLGGITILAHPAQVKVTAGSDFHGREIKPNVPLDGLRGGSYELVEKLRWAKKARDG